MVARHLQDLEALAARYGLRLESDLVEDLLTTIANVAVLDQVPRQGRTARADLEHVLDHARAMRAVDNFLSEFPGEHVTIFGSARTARDSETYELVAATARRLADVGYWVRNGSGPGAMEAATRGAGGAAPARRAVEVKIALPFEPLDPESDDVALVLDQFSNRKVALIRGVRALIAAPGGFGTLDEFYETITLMQTGKHPIMPVFLLEPEGLGLWAEVQSLNRKLLEIGAISPHDLELMEIVHGPDQIIEGINRFYETYHSYIRTAHHFHKPSNTNISWLIMRLQPGKHLPISALQELHSEFAEIMAIGGVEYSDVSEKELRQVERDLSAIPAMCEHFPEYGGLKALDDWPGLGGLTASRARVEADVRLNLPDADDRGSLQSIKTFYELPRIGFWFKDRSYAKLAQFISRVNDIGRDPQRPAQPVLGR